MKFLILVLYLSACSGYLSYTNFVCTSLDLAFSHIDHCFIKAVNRSYQYISAATILHQSPVTNVSVRIAVLKRANGYKPFLYNITVDACRFLRARHNPVIKFFYAIIYKYTNVNHSCPFSNSVIVEKLPNYHLDNEFTKTLPVPKGDYAFFTTWYAYNIPRADLNVYVTLK